MKKLILELNGISWEKCFLIIEENRKHDEELGYKITESEEKK